MSGRGSRSDRGGVALVAGAAAALATLGVISNVAYAAGMSAPVFTALRAALGASILGALVLSGRQPRVALRGLERRERRMLAIAVLANGTMNLVLFAGFQVMTVALVMTVYYTYPLVVTVVLAATRQERLTPSRIGALVVAMAGLVLVVGSQAGPGAHVSLTGIALGLAASVCQATYLLVSRDGYASVPAVQATSLILLGGMVLSGAAAVLGGTLGSSGGWLAEPAAWLAILLAGTLGAALPKVMLLMGVRRIGGTRTALIMLSEPVIAVAFAALLLGQPLNAAEIVGGAAILVAAAIVQRSRPGREVPPVTSQRPSAVGSHE